eukprot:1047921-Rhodomonas_salina.2
MDSAGGAEAAAATAITLGGGRKLLETCESNTTGLNCTLCTQNQYSRSCDVSCQSTRTCSGHGYSSPVCSGRCDLLTPIILLPGDAESVGTRARAMSRGKATTAP